MEWKGSGLPVDDGVYKPLPPPWPVHDLAYPPAVGRRPKKGRDLFASPGGRHFRHRYRSLLRPSTVSSVKDATRCRGRSGRQTRPADRRMSVRIDGSSASSMVRFTNILQQRLLCRTV